MQSSVFKWESGATTPRGHRLERLAEELHVDQFYLTASDEEIAKAIKNNIKTAATWVFSSAEALSNVSKVPLAEITDALDSGQMPLVSQAAIEKICRLETGALASPFTTFSRAHNTTDPNHPLTLSAATEVAKPASEDDDDELRAPTADEFAFIPQLDLAAACGSGQYAESEHVVVKGSLAFKRSSLKDFGVSERAARIIYAAGGSMSPTIKDGCVVLIDTADTQPREGRVYAVAMPDGGLVLKRLVFEYRVEFDANAWVMRSDNADKHTHPDKLLPPDDRTMIIGRAVWNDNRL